jgi:hypothetical protein
VVNLHPQIRPPLSREWRKSQRIVAVDEASRLPDNVPISSAGFSSERGLLPASTLTQPRRIGRSDPKLRASSGVVTRHVFHMLSLGVPFSCAGLGGYRCHRSTATCAEVAC